MIAVGSCCSLYKTCNICGDTKMVYEFSSAGGRKRKGRRRSYCKGCKGAKKFIPKQVKSIMYFEYDISILRESDINATRPISQGRLVRFVINHEKAVAWVEGGVAGITSEGSIRKLYTRKDFKKMILERDDYTCVYCGEFGNTVDHLTARVNGGMSTFTNCVCACKKCNGKKGNLSVENYIKKIGVTSHIEISRKKQEIVRKAFVPEYKLFKCK